MTAPAPEGTKTTHPVGDRPTEPTRPETAISAEAQRGIGDCDAIIRDCKAIIAATYSKLERAVMRRTMLRISQRVVGIEYEEGAE
jgi:hypothetical protein